MVYDCGKYKITLKKIIRRLESIPDDSRNMWLSEILSHFGNRYGGFKYAQGFEQGLIEGFQNGLDEAKSEKVIVQVPKLIANWIEYCKELNIDLIHSMNPSHKIFNPHVAFKGKADVIFYWILDNSELYARAFLDGYEVKPEKQYSIAVPVGNGWYNRVIVYNSGNVGLDSHNYMSLDKLRKHDRQSAIPLTEDLIKDSELSWAWQFATELED
jgi:hypothetical protein